MTDAAALEALAVRVERLTDNQRECLEDLVHVCGWPIKANDNWWAKPMHIGGSNGSHHGPCLYRLSKRGLCDRSSYIWGHRRVNAYRPNEARIDPPCKSKGPDQ